MRKFKIVFEILIEKQKIESKNGEKSEMAHFIESVK